MDWVEDSDRRGIWGLGPGVSDFYPKSLTFLTDPLFLALEFR
jgi:hypothetical protein